MEVNGKMRSTYLSLSLCATCARKVLLACAPQNAEDVKKADRERVSCEKLTVGVESTRFSFSDGDWRHMG